MRGVFSLNKKLTGRMSALLEYIHIIVPSLFSEIFIVRHIRCECAHDCPVCRQIRGFEFLLERLGLALSGAAFYITEATEMQTSRVLCEKHAPTPIDFRVRMNN